MRELKGAKVLMLLSNPFRPDPRVHKEAKALVNAGYDVKILAWSREGGYPLKETIDGIKITRIDIRGGYGSFSTFLYALPLFWLRIFLETMLSARHVVHCHDLDTLPPGWLAARISNKKVVFDAHEMYAEMIKDDVPGWIYNLAQRVEDFLVPRVDLLVTVNDPFKKRYTKKGALRAVTIMGCDTLQPPPKWDNDMEGLDRPILLYIGVLEPTRMILEAIETVTGSKIGSMVIGGFGSLENEVKRMASEHSNIRFIGRVDPEKIRGYDAQADILMAIYDPSNLNNRFSVPNKLFEAMSVSKPIIVAEGTFTSSVVQEEDCGFVIPYGDENALANVLREMKVDDAKSILKGRRGYEAYQKKYNWEKMAGKLQRAYAYLVSN